MRNSTPEERRRFVELWFEFARLHEEYKDYCGGEAIPGYDDLYKKIGNIHEIPFEQWWESYGRRFGILDFSIFPTRSERDFQDYCDADDAMILVVNLHAPKKVLKEKFNELLRDYHPRRGAGRPRAGDRDDVQAEVMKLRNAGHDPKLAKRIAYLELVLCALRLKTRDYLPAHEIAVRLKINEKRSDTSVLQNRKILAAAVNRLIRNAYQIIDSVFDGEFPKYEK